jgi:hypothetical protein
MVGGQVRHPSYILPPIYNLIDHADGAQEIGGYRLGVKDGRHVLVGGQVRHPSYFLPPIYNLICAG